MKHSTSSVAGSHPSNNSNGLSAEAAATSDATNAAPCIDLNERFGRRYRTERDESYFADRGEGARAHDP